MKINPRRFALVRTVPRVALSIGIGLLLALLPLLAGAPAWATGPAPIAVWKSLDPAHLVAFPSGATPADRWGTPHDRVQGYLRKPVGDGPFPAVVLLHSVNGVALHQVRWAERLAEWGFVGLLVNSTRPGAAVGMDNLAHDAYGALRFLRGQTYVDPGRIAVIGWGMGSLALLHGLEADPERAGGPRPEFTADGTLRFRAAVAYHSQCPKLRAPRFYAPTLLLEGERMFTGRPEDCQRFAQSAQNGGAPVRVKLFPGATPGFDFGKDREFLRFKIFYNPAAEQDAIGEVKQFLTASFG